ncbi:MsnO8 family LLM class oxidoreductase [Devosia sp. A369]
MKLSIVDLATIKPGETATDALRQALDTVRLAEALGFHRIWFAEHHMAPAQASHHPELLIAAAGTQTRHIRLGSGAVLMNHYSPFKVAEMFKQLDAMFPDRIDLGMGRATAGPAIDLALRRDRKSQPVDDHSMQVSEVLAWLHNAFPAGHPFANKPLIPTVSTIPESWLLGSSPGGSRLAAQLGIGYTFAGFINPQAAASSLRTYRDNFVATPFGAGAPRAMLGVNVSVGETDEDGQRLALSAKGFYQRLSRLGAAAYVPTIEEADRELGDAERAEPTRIVGGRWPRFIAGGPEEVKATLDEMIDQSGADEVIVQDLIANPEDRARSHERIAKAFGLTPREPIL